jgi:hypothetical protein
VAVVPADGCFTYSATKKQYKFMIWTSQSRTPLTLPPLVISERGIVGVYIHTHGHQYRDIQCWLNNPKASDWIDITHDYVNDTGKVLHPEIPAYCLTSLSGPKFILVTSFRNRARQHNKARAASVVYEVDEADDVGETDDVDKAGGVDEADGVDETDQMDVGE